MKQLSRSGKIAFTCIAALAFVFGAAVLVQPVSGDPGGPLPPPPPEPQCGWATIWICSGPDDDVFFGGTQCDAAAFEAETGRTCVPFGF